MTKATKTIASLSPCIGDEWAWAVVYTPPRKPVEHFDITATEPSLSVFCIFPAADYVFMGSGR